MLRDLAHLSNEALVLLMARGEEGALAELYDRHGRVAYGLAVRVVRDSQLAEDAVQEGFLAAWRGSGSYAPERGRAVTWLLTFVHRRSVDIVRREQRRRAEPFEPESSGAGGGADEEAWLRVERKQVQQALVALPDPQREAIELAYYGGLTQTELAARLGQPLGTIKSRMFAGLSRLAELLAESGEETRRWKPPSSTT